MNFNGILIGSEEPDSWIATFADPDDNYFQLVTPMDPNAMGGDG